MHLLLHSAIPVWSKSLYSLSVDPDQQVEFFLSFLHLCHHDWLRHLYRVVLHTQKAVYHLQPVLRSPELIPWRRLCTVFPVPPRFLVSSIDRESRSSYFAEYTQALI